MRKRGAPVHACASEALAFDKSGEYLFIGNFVRGTGQQFAEDFQAMFFAAGMCIAKHAIRFDELVEGHVLK